MEDDIPDALESLNLYFVGKGNGQMRRETLEDISSSTLFGYHLSEVGLAQEKHRTGKDSLGHLVQFHVIMCYII